MNTHKPRVFVIQQPSVFDKQRKTFKPKYDLSPAREFGRLVFVLGPGNIFVNRLPQTILHMQNIFSDFTDQDFLLAIGDPVAIAAASYITGARTGGKINMLKWDHNSGSYFCFSINVKSEQDYNDDKN